MSSKGRTPAKLSALDKKVPENPKYKSVQSSIDTGHTMKKAMQKYDGTSGPNARTKIQDEYFIRLKATTLAGLIDVNTEAEESIYKLETDDTISMSSLSVVDQSEGSSKPSMQGTLLLLDLRSQEEFDEFHIRTATSYPIQMLSRATNYFTAEIYQYKGPRDGSKMIVLYDSDGKSALTAGNQFVEKGVENTYVISGGIKDFGFKFPHLIEGDMTPPTPSSSRSVRDSSSRLNTGTSRRSVESSRTDQSVTSMGSRVSNATSSTPWK